MSADLALAAAPSSVERAAYPGEFNIQACGPAEAWLAVRTRAGSCCEACGIWLGVHEGRVGRRRAGDYPFRGTVDNACLFCGRCNLAVVQRDPQMNAAGFWLASTEDPREVPILLHNMDECRVWLTQSGTYSVTPPEDKMA